MNNITFYDEWLPLDKNDFRILAMLSDKGTFSGNLSDLCKYFSLSVQTSSRRRLKTSIEALEKNGFIECTHKGQNYTLKAIPKGKKIEIQRVWYLSLLHHKRSSESVAWEQVLKVYLWLAVNKEPVITDNMIADALSISTSTVGCAKNVLEKDFTAIKRKIVAEKHGDVLHRCGQEIILNAWWDI